MQIRCSSCGKPLQVDERSAGKRVKCPCGTILQVPGNVAATAAAKPTTVAGPAKAASTAGPAKSAASAGAAKASPAPTRPAPASATAAPGAFGVDHSEMASLFGELTESDMVVKGPSTLPPKGKKAKDPLAGYATGEPAAAPKRRKKKAAKPSDSGTASGQKKTVLIVIVSVIVVAGIGAAAFFLLR